MTKIIATNKGNNEFIQSITLMLGTSNKIDSVEQYLEQPVNKLVMLVKTDESWVWFPDSAKGSRCLEHLEGSHMLRAWTCLEARYSLRDYRSIFNLAKYFKVIFKFWLVYEKHVLC